MPWDNFSTLLAFDYVWRYFLCLMFAWPPPQYAIKIISAYLASMSGSKNKRSKDLALDTSFDSVKHIDKQPYQHLNDSI